MKSSNPLVFLFLSLAVFGILRRAESRGNRSNFKKKLNAVKLAAAKKGESVDSSHRRGSKVPKQIFFNGVFHYFLSF